LTYVDDRIASQNQINLPFREKESECSTFRTNDESIQQLEPIVNKHPFIIKKNSLLSIRGSAKNHFGQKSKKEAMRPE